MAKVGEQAPEFSLHNAEGAKLSLRELRGKKVVVFFYPKDDTPGCTKEACGFRDAHAGLKKAGAVVLGISPDSVESHQRFRDKFTLDFPLLADPDHQAIAAYGVWKEKSMYGKKFMGVERSTFLIDEQGVLRREWRKVKVDGHVDEVVASLAE